MRGVNGLCDFMLGTAKKLAPPHLPGELRAPVEAGEDVAALGAGITPVDIRPEDEPEEDEDARPVAPPAERGGCQSCALVGPGSSRGGLVALPLLALVLPRLSGRRRRAAGARR